MYPCVETDEGKGKKEVMEEGRLWEDKKLILSINRFERKKDIGLALKAFAGLDHNTKKNARLVIAGKLPYFPNTAHHTHHTNRVLQAGTTTACKKTSPIT